MRPTHALQCRCGEVRGTLAGPAEAVRVVCYCRDCQTAAHALGGPERTLDGQGGTSIVASAQHRIAFTQGIGRLRCMSLTERGIYRWSAGCCGTPIANMVHRPQMSYVGIVHTCLGESARRVAEAWPRAFAVNTAHAKGPVATSRVETLVGGLKIAKLVLGARLSGRWRESPFFRQDSGRPIAAVEVLSPEALETARRAV